MLIKNYDTRNAGRLNVVNFKTCLLNAKLQLSVTEVNILMGKERFMSIHGLKISSFGLNNN